MLETAAHGVSEWLTSATGGGNGVVIILKKAMAGKNVIAQFVTQNEPIVKSAPDILMATTELLAYQHPVHPSGPLSGTSNRPNPAIMLDSLSVGP